MVRVTGRGAFMIHLIFLEGGERIIANVVYQLFELQRR